MKISAKTPEDFWRLVDRTPGLGPHGKCWVWRGNVDHGYGYVYYQGKKVRAHRLAWSLASTKTPMLGILHSCDYKLCCNPSHLREGTPKDNIMDARIRGRQYTKLTWQSVERLRGLLAEGVGLREVARLFNIRHSTAAQIRDYVTWQPLPSPDDLKRCQSAIPETWNTLVGVK